jgi:Domain of unknown function (DUF4145)
MPELVADCPRCGSREMTFDVGEANWVSTEYGWKRKYETFCVCRRCKCATIFVLSNQTESDYTGVNKIGILNIKGALNRYFDNHGYISLKDKSTIAPPEHIPPKIEAVFKEGATCLAVACYNAAGTMFRLCVDLATRSMLPKEDTEGLNAKTRWNLGHRLPWLFKTGKLPMVLQGLSSCIKEDGNDAAHAGTLTRPEAEDLLDFTTALLERIYTEPERLRLAEVRRVERREKSS